MCFLKLKSKEVYLCVFQFDIKGDKRGGRLSSFCIVLFFRKMYEKQLLVLMSLPFVAFSRIDYYIVEAQQGLLLWFAWKFEGLVDY